MKKKSTAAPKETVSAKIPADTKRKLEVKAKRLDRKVGWLVAKILVANA